MARPCNQMEHGRNLRSISWCRLILTHTQIAQPAGASFQNPPERLLGAMHRARRAVGIHAQGEGEVRPAAELTGSRLVFSYPFWEDSNGNDPGHLGL